MAEPSAKLLRRSSTLKIVKQDEVSAAEEDFHKMGEHEGTAEEGGNGGHSNGVFADDGQKLQGWDKIMKSINLSAALNTSAPQVEEGGTLDLNTEDFRVGIPYRFKVHLEQLPGKTLVVTCDPSDGATIKIATHEKEGVVTYMCTLIPLREGEFAVSTLFGKKHVLGSPFKVNFNSPADASLCTLKEAPEECRTSVDTNTVTFCIHTNQEREGLLTAVAKSLTGKKSVAVLVTENGKSHYDIEFDANDGKKYRLSVKFDNQHINGSPFLLHLSDAMACSVTGAGVVQGVTAQENHFEVFTKGAGPGKLKVKVEGKSQAVVIIKPKENDVYDVTYFPKKAGKYHITVLWLDEEVPGSPFLVNCYKPVGVTTPKPEKSNVYMTGECYKFKIDAKESGEGTLEASTVEEDAADVNVLNTGRGQYRVEVTPKKTGTIHISILWGGTVAPGGPFPMEVDCKPDSSQITTSGPVYEVGSSKPVTLEVNTEKAGAGKLKAKCAGKKSKNVPVTVSEGAAKTYVVSFNPPKPDIYTLWVTWSKTQVPGSPFTVNLHPSNSSSCQLIGAPIVPEDWKEPATLTISTIGAGNGKVEAKAEGETSGVLADEHLQITEKDGGETEVKLVAPSPDIYKLSVTWTGEEIPKSPFILNRITPDAEKCFTSVSRLRKDWDEDMHIYADATAAGNGELTALAVGDTFGDMSECVSITEDENQYGKFIVKLSPTEQDIYTVTLQWGGKPVPGFPCRLNQIQYQPDKVKVDEPDGVIEVGQDITIGVDTSKGGPGKLTASCLAKKRRRHSSHSGNSRRKQVSSLFHPPRSGPLFPVGVLEWGRHSWVTVQNQPDSSRCLSRALLWA
jgi:filamin